MLPTIVIGVVIRFQVCIFDILNTAKLPIAGGSSKL